MKRKGKIEDLRWVRLFTSSHIPKYLVEQIAKRDYTVDNFFKHLESEILQPSQNGPVLNPCFHVWALVDPSNLVKGFVWFTIDTLSQDIVIQVFSMDSNYWGKGAVEKLAEHVKMIRKKADLNKIYWITHFPKHSAKYDFKASKNVLMEYNEEEIKEEKKENGKDSHGIKGNNGSSETRTASISTDSP